MGTTPEEPAVQPNRGDYNSTIAAGTITTGTPRADGESVNVQSLLFVQQPGKFHFYIVIEALPSTAGHARTRYRQRRVRPDSRAGRTQPFFNHK